MPPGIEARGVGMFQQTDKPVNTMLTAHWDSVEQHGVWIASQENKSFYPKLQQYINMDRTRFFHVDGVQAFTEVEEEGLRAVLSSPVVYVARCYVETGRRDEFEKRCHGLKGVCDAGSKPFVQRGGWRVEKDARDGSEGREEYVLIGGCEAVVKASELEGLGLFVESLKGPMVNFDINFYKRFL